MPYHSFGASWGALAVTTAWTRSAITRSAPCISAILASTSCSASAAFSACEPRRAAAFCSLACSFIAARSSAENPSYVPLLVLLMLSPVAHGSPRPTPVRAAGPGPSRQYNIPPHPSPQGLLKDHSNPLHPLPPDGGTAPPTAAG